MPTNKKAIPSTIISLSRRIICSTIDGVIAVALVFGLAMTIDAIGWGAPGPRLLMAFIGLSYEPLCSKFGRTVGQWFTGVQVRNYKTGKRINLYEAYLRYFFKVTLGWKGLIFHDETDGRMIHDRFAETILEVSQRSK